MLMKTTVAPTPSLAGTSGITLDALRVSYHGNVVLKPLTLTIEPGEVLALIGPSGSGKTTVLRAIAGFVQPAGGRILLGDTDITHLPPYQRGLGMVVQNYALFPHMKVEDNVAFGLRAQKQSKAQIAERVQEALKIVGMADYASRYPHQLSGGQRQRVAIARALVNQPRVLLLDEPLGALDLKLREQMQLELKKLQQALGITFIFVTHDQGEALSMSDRVAVFNNGRIEQVDAPQDLYLRPKTAFVAGFVGTANVFSSEQAHKLCAMAGTWSLRPEHIRLNVAGEIQTEGVVQAVQYQGAATRVELKLANGEKLLVSQANSDGHAALNAPPVGQTVLASWSRAAMVPLESGG